MVAGLKGQNLPSPQAAYIDHFWVKYSIFNNYIKSYLVVIKLTIG